MHAGLTALERYVADNADEHATETVMLAAFDHEDSARSRVVVRLARSWRIFWCACRRARREHGGVPPFGGGVVLPVG